MHWTLDDLLALPPDVYEVLTQEAARLADTGED